MDQATCLDVARRTGQTSYGEAYVRTPLQPANFKKGCYLHYNQIYYNPWDPDNLDDRGGNGGSRICISAEGKLGQWRVLAISLSE